MIPPRLLPAFLFAVALPLSATPPDTSPTTTPAPPATMVNGKWKMENPPAPPTTPAQQTLARFLQAYRQGDAAGVKACLDFQPSANPQLADPTAVFEATIAPQLAQIALLRAAEARFPKELHLTDLLPIEDPDGPIQRQLADLPRMIEHQDADGASATLLTPTGGTASVPGLPTTPTTASDLPVTPVITASAEAGAEAEPAREAIPFRRAPGGDWHIVASAWVEPLTVAECQARAASSRAVVQAFTQLRADLQAGRIETVDELVKKTRKVTEEFLNPAAEPGATPPATTPATIPTGTPYIPPDK